MRFGSIQVAFPSRSVFVAHQIAFPTLLVPHFPHEAEAFQNTNRAVPVCERVLRRPKQDLALYEKYQKYPISSGFNAL